MVSAIGRSSLRRRTVRRRGDSSQLRGTPEGAPLAAQAAMQSLRKMLITVAVLGAGAGVGSALFVIVTPRGQRKQEMLKVETTGSPEVGWAGGEPRTGAPANLFSCPQEMPLQDPLSRDEVARTKQLVMDVLQEAATTQENVAWRKNWIVGGEGGKGGKSA
ncbi:Ubiquinol-cytochrome-c reductase complex assembly factor 3 [Saguinus oedipus]|uniref:Ubiquinol-cytochrome-c reductase complex assembly factor 3 n=1 Tax=Saguinus oedipus TaxID=9490 RepID=A0ABQ9UV06_SAGOE|nr:Ubiquinol-cytochrome-c reductase complex assembly factor 3 [Saguinus oedipus]